jgi:hypothetical protein
MKIHLHKQGVLLVGKAWEIRRKLQEYSSCYKYVSDWISDEKQISIKSPKVIPIEKNKPK